MRPKSCHILIIILLLLVSGCSSTPSEDPAEPTPVMTMRVTSTVFEEGGEIPEQYTCDGEDISPPLLWSGGPEETESFAIVVEDPDAPGGTFTHWVVYNLSADRTRFIEGEQAGQIGANDFHNLGYRGPCPPPGAPHRYYFKVFALDSMLNLRPGASVKILSEAMQGHVLAQGQLMGVYGR